MAERWEHLIVTIRWESTQQQWCSDWSEVSSHDSYDTILDAVGDEGWELVSLSPYMALIVTLPVRGELDERHWAPTRYSAVFKRRKP